MCCPCSTIINQLLACELSGWLVSLSGCQVGGVPLERALSGSHLNYLKYGTTVLAGRYFLLAEHGVPVPRRKDGGIVLGYTTGGLRALLRRMRRHDSQGRLPAEDDAAVESLRQWLDAWPETDSGRQWHCP